MSATHPLSGQGRLHGSMAWLKLLYLSLYPCIEGIIEGIEVQSTATH